MNFKAHCAGGAVVALSCSTVSYLTLEGASLDIGNHFFLFGVCFFMSLFPDLDTASIPQRWFYRLMVPIIIYLYYYKYFDLVFLSALFMAAPLLHRHRGWTHYKVTPFLMAFIFLWFYDSREQFYEIDKQYLLTNYILFIISVVLGHYTHLVLDSKAIKIFGNSSDHH